MEVVKSNLRKYIIAIGALLLGFCLWYFKSIVVYIVIAAILSLIGHPIVAFLDKIKISKFRIPRALNAFLTLVLIWVIIITVLRFIIPVLANEAKELSTIDVNSFIESFNKPLETIENTLYQLNILDKEDISFEEDIKEKIKPVINVSFLSNIFTTIAGIMGDLFIAIFAISFISFFFLKDEKLFVEGIILFVPFEHEERVRHVLSSIKNLLVRYFIGICVQITSISILVTSGLSIVGIGFNHAIVIGLFAGVINVIPYVGPIIGAIFGLTVGVATNLNLDFYTEILPLIGYMGIVFALVQIIDNTIFQPVIFSSSVKAHPLEIFLVIMISASLAGIIGMILAIPFYTILRVIAKEFFNKFKLIKKITEKI